MLSLLTIFLYSLSAYLIYQLKEDSEPSKLLNQKWVCLTPGLAAIALHTILLKESIYLADGFNLSIYTVSSLIGWLVSLQILLGSLRQRVETLAVIMFPLSAMVVLLNQLYLSNTNIIDHISSGIQSHILFSLMAYSLLMLAVLQALALAYQHRSLKSHHPIGLVKKLPPLQDMESLLFQIVSYSFLFLSVSLLSGFLFFEDLFAQHLIHKTILSIIGWGSLFTLLIGRQLFGWRGNIAIRWTIISFTFILLAYLGSKFVLEVLL